MGKKYKDELYIESLEALLGDIYYCAGVSNNTRIANLRRLTEFIVRRLIKHSPESKLELGDNRTINALKKAGVTEDFFYNSFNIVKRNGNDRTHTQIYSVATDEELSETSEAVLNLYAYLFFDYFKKYEFGTNLDVVKVFSLLPPYFRFIILRELLYGGLSNSIAMDTKQYFTWRLYRNLRISSIKTSARHRNIYSV